MLKKRESFGHTSTDSTIRKEFIKENLSVLQTLGGRQKYFIEYEFPRKQQNLIKFWHDNLDLAFRSYFKSSTVLVASIIELFTIESSHPNFTPIFTELCNQKEIALVARADDVRSLIKILNERENKTSFFEKLKNLIGVSGPTKIEVQRDSHVVNISLLQTSILRVESAIEEIFRESPIVPETDFLRLLDEEAQVSGFEAKLVINILLAKARIFSFRNRSVTFYQHHSLDEEGKQAYVSEWEIDRKVAVLRAQIEQFEDQAKEKLVLALKFKEANSKAQAMNALSQKKMLMRTVEDLTSRMLMLEEMKVKIQSARSNKELNVLLKQTNNLLKASGDPVDLIDQVELIRERDFTQEQLNNEVRQIINVDELEDVFNNLDESNQNISEKKTPSQAYLKKERQDEKKPEVKPAHQLTDHSIDDKIRQLLDD